MTQPDLIENISVMRAGQEDPSLWEQVDARLDQLAAIRLYSNEVGIKLACAELRLLCSLEERLSKMGDSLEANGSINLIDGNSFVFQATDSFVARFSGGLHVHAH